MEEKDLNIILEVRAGSHAYGTNTPESDEDFRGIAIAPIDCYLGTLQRFEQLEQTQPTDRVLYDIQKFCRLALEANPNILEMLYTESPDIILCTCAGKMLRENRHLFLSTKVRFTFLGYAFAQLKRIKTHRNWLMNPPSKKPERAHFGLPDHKLIALDQQEAFIWMCSRIISDTLEEATLSQETRQELLATNFHGCLQSSIPDEIWPLLQRQTGATENFIYAMKQERAYSNALAAYNSYLNWQKTRNPKRAALEAKCGFDTKHALHLVRLIRMGSELLSGKGLIVKRPDAQELLAIRNGAWTFEQVENYAKDMEVRFEELYKSSPLPKIPDHKKVNDLCLAILETEFAKRI
jgi:predicted nucleotidyltransferase